MFSNRERKRTRGFILIYVMFIVTLCIFIALNCFKLEVLKRENNLNMERNILKVECTQKVKEHIFTELNELLYKNVTNLSDEGLKEYLNSLSDHVVTYENSYVEYNKKENCFELVYYVNGKFYKKELYEYKIKNNFIFYNCVDCDFEEGGK